MKQFSDQEKQSFIDEFNALMKKGGATRKSIIQSIAKKHGFGFSTFNAWLSNKKPRRKTGKRAQSAKPTESDWEKAFNTYIANRDAANTHLAQAKIYTRKMEEAKKVLEKIVKEL